MNTDRNTPVWDDGNWRGLATLDGDASADVCVVGLGGSGLTCVRALLRGGASVIGIDAGEVAGGAAGRNGGFLLAGTYDFYHDAVARHGHHRARRIYRRARRRGSGGRAQRDRQSGVAGYGDRLVVGLGAVDPDLRTDAQLLAADAAAAVAVGRR